jgi:hypothetical protein
VADIEDKIAAVLLDHQMPEPSTITTGGVSWDCECGTFIHQGSQPDVWSALAAHQAAMLAPLVREAQRAAFEVGVTRGIAYQAGNNDALANPYRIEKEA